LAEEFASQFRINRNGRPEGTAETDRGVIHYTCNPPRQEVLGKYNILPIGRKFNIGESEVLLIDRKYFSKVNTIEVENFLRRIDLETGG
jgi:hypothetical protein